jgi:hypothetical protein
MQIRLRYSRVLYFLNGYRGHSATHDGRKIKAWSQSEQQLLDWFPRRRYVGYQLYDSSIDKRNQNISQRRRRRASCGDNNEQDACVIIHVEELMTAIQPDTLLDRNLICFNCHNDVFHEWFSFILLMTKNFKRSSNYFAFVLLCEHFRNSESRDDFMNSAFFSTCHFSNFMNFDSSIFL